MSSRSSNSNIEHYRYAVQWSPEDGEFVATVAEFPSLSWLAQDQLEAIRGLEKMLRQVIEDMETSGEFVPEPLSDRTYSGRLNLRVSEGLHRKLAIEALQHQTSLNAYVTQLLDRQQSA
jgi:predicted HicB family RNase H-like nuclease